MVPRSLLLLPLIALAASAMLARSAMGSCGDWLQHVSDNQEAGRTLSTENKTDEYRQPTPEPPCQGPHCQGSPWSPLQAPTQAPVVERHSDCVAYLTGRQQIFFTGTARPIFESPFRVTRGGLLRIDRPPIS